MAQPGELLKPELEQDEYCPPLNPSQQLGVQAPEQEGGLEPQVEQPQMEPLEEQRQLTKMAKRTSSNPRQRNPTGPHGSKDTADEPWKRA
jgi:hypothetical protein